MGENGISNRWNNLLLHPVKVPVQIQNTHHLEDGLHPLVVVSCYTNFKELAHRPRGTESAHGLYVYRLDPSDGSLTLLTMQKGDKNPAFTRVHPTRNILYTCTESVMEHGEVVTYEIDKIYGKLERIGTQVAGGKSTCYITMAPHHMLVVNYWDATVVSFPVEKDTGKVLPSVSTYYPKGADWIMQVQAGCHAHHSENDAQTQKERQKDPHSHAVVLDPFLGCICYVPDLGLDVIHELFFDKESGSLTFLSDIHVGVDGRVHGPRYCHFHPTLPVVYCINEIASEVAVFKVDREAIASIREAVVNKTVEGDLTGKFPPTLIPMQNISTIPHAFPNALNTCGRITVHPSGNFVLVSNRGHNSLAVFHVKANRGGLLALVGCFHTRGETPRHFQFDKSGQWLIVANQDSNNLSVFNFNLASGKLRFTTNQYNVPSPNFVAFCDPHDL